MANLIAALRQVRRTRQRLDASQPEIFERYQAEYKVILEAIADLAGDSAYDDLKEWMIETTKDRQRLPTPAEVRRHARKLCHNRDITVPRTSPLRE